MFAIETVDLPDEAARQVVDRLLPIAPELTTGQLRARLRPDKAAKATARIDELAKAAKQAGDPRSMDELRADPFLDILNANWSSTAGSAAAHQHRTRRS